MQKPRTDHIIVFKDLYIYINKFIIHFISIAISSCRREEKIDRIVYCNVKTKIRQKFHDILKKEL